MSYKVKTLKKLKLTKPNILSSFCNFLYEAVLLNFGPKFRKKCYIPELVSEGQRTNGFISSYISLKKRNHGHALIMHALLFTVENRL